jgi:hypothetical protein
VVVSDEEYDRIQEEERPGVLPPQTGQAGAVVWRNRLVMA